LIGLGLAIADFVVTAIEAKSSTASSDPKHIGIFLLFPAWVRPNSPENTGDIAC
jgi:hypothetical protein